MLLHIVLGHIIHPENWLLVMECDFHLMRDTDFHGPSLPFQEDTPNFCESTADSPTTICLLVMLFLQDMVFTVG